MSAALALGVLLAGGLAAAAPLAAEPSLAELERAALRCAGLDGEDLRALARRIRVSAAAPSLRVMVGRGTGVLQTTSEFTGSTRITLGDNNALQMQFTATWSLDKLVFHPEEVRLLREIQRAAAHREQLITQVATLYLERRRLIAALAQAPPAAPMEGIESRLRLEEITAVLDALTGGALSAATR